jgi:SAM-dependent methyltransferase
LRHHTGDGSYGDGLGCGEFTEKTRYKYLCWDCCGSVLSLVDSADRALDEIARVLKPGGTFFVEVECRWNGDAFWPLIDKLAGGFFNYEASWTEAMIPLRRPWSASVQVEYPFGEAKDPVYMDLRLFTRRNLSAMLRRRGLVPTRWQTIHSATNLLPSTVLHSSTPSRKLQGVFSILRAVERATPVALPGCSLVVSGSKP